MPREGSICQNKGSGSPELGVKLNQNIHPHPTLFLRKEVYQKYGLFDTSFRVAGDYDFMLRILLDRNARLEYVPEVITLMKMGGISTGNLRSLLRKSKEDIRALKNNGFRYPLLVLAKKNLRKIPQLYVR